MRAQTPLRHDFSKYQILDLHSIFVVLKNATRNVLSTWSEASFTYPILRHIKDPQHTMSEFKPL